jgi:hypothetical protein
MNKQGRKMTTENTKPYEGKTCFVITPIGGDSTDIRREADGIIDEVLIPILEDELGFTVEVAHRVDSSGSITQQVIQSVINSDFAICNLATLNPNVMYELALRHAARKPVVTIAPKGTSLPFDISDDRVVFYRNDIAGALQLKTDIQPKICSAMKDDAPDNPVYRAIKSGKIMQEVHAEGGPNAAILNAIEGLTKKVNSIQSSSRGELKYSYSDNDPFKTQTITIIKPDLKKFEDNETEALKSIINQIQDSSDLKIPIYFGTSGNNMIVYVGEHSKFNSHVSDFIFRLLREIAAAATERGYQVL